VTPSRLDLALVTCAELPEPDPDAAPLAAALAENGIASELLAWDDPQADWSRAKLTVLRSAWNYPQQRDAFLGWAERTAQLSTLWNPLDVVRWNSHKGYLLELEERGLPVTPTALIRRGADVPLEQLLDQRDWPEVVVKPAVSASSFRTLRVSNDNLAEGQTHMQSLLAERDVLVQRYLSSVEDYGERALVWIDGELTHAVRKSPRFEGQDESVSSAAVPITHAESELARRVIDAVGTPLLYARVDVAPGPGGDPVLMELELVEPSLFFPQGPAALERFVAGIRLRLRTPPAGTVSAR